HRAIRDKEVEAPIVVVVKPFHTEAREGNGEPREAVAQRQIFELPMAVVPKKRHTLASEIGDEQVLSAVAIEVLRRNPHAGARDAVGGIRNARFKRHLAKGAVLLTHPKQVGGSIVGYEDVGPAIAIEIGGDDSEARTICAADT